MIGRDPEHYEATFESFIAAIHPDDREAVQQLAARASMGDVAERADFGVVRGDGSIREITGLAQIFRAADGVPYRMLGVAMDVTERRRLEQRLQQSQKMEALGRLAGSVAHDFNNLLTIVLLNLQMLSRRSTSGRELDHIRDAAARGAGLASQLLVFSRGSMRAATALDLNRVVSGSLELLEGMIGESVVTRFRRSAIVPTIVATNGSHADQAPFDLMI